MRDIIYNFAVDSVMGFRKNSRIPWEPRNDDALTRDKVCVANLDTYVTIMERHGEERMKELGKSRFSILVADENLEIPDVKVVNSYRDAIEFGKTMDKDIVIIGSVDLFEEFYDDVTVVTVSVHAGDYGCDHNVKHIIDRVKKEFEVTGRRITEDGVKVYTYQRK